MTREYRLHPALLIFAASVEGERVWVVETNCAEPPLKVKDPLVLWALSVLPETFTEADASSVWSREAAVAQRSADLWSLLLGEGLVVDIAARSPSIDRSELWRRYGWDEAFAFQEGTRSYPFVQMNVPEGFREDGRRMRRYRHLADPPPIYLNAPAEEIVPLRRWIGPEAVPRADGAVGTPENTADALALILDYCAGERGQLDLGAQGPVLLKSVPSGGARHPSEIYLFLFNTVAGLTPGGYHYRVATHSLARLVTGDFSTLCREATFDLFDKYDRAPFGLVLFTLRVERAMWRYRDARSARAPLIDVGHVIMAFRTAANMAGIKYYTYQKFQERSLCDILSINQIAEPPIYVGTLV